MGAGEALDRLRASDGFRLAVEATTRSPVTGWGFNEAQELCRRSEDSEVIQFWGKGCSRHAQGCELGILAACGIEPTKAFRQQLQDAFGNMN